MPTKAIMGIALSGRLWRMLAQPRRLQTQLIVFALMIAIPIGAFSGYLLWRFAKQERAEFEILLQQKALTLASDVDRQLESMQTLLRTLATSRSLRERNWAEFHDQASAALQGTGFWLVAAQSNAQQTMNTLVPFASALPEIADRETLRRVLETREMVVGNLFVGSVIQRPVINIALPLIERGAVEHVLFLTFTPDVLRRIITEQSLPDGWIGGLTDGNATVVSRSVDHDKFVNTKLSQQLIDQQDRIGVFEAQRLDGSASLRAVRRLKNANWVAAVTVDRSLAVASTYQALGAMLLLGIALLAAAFAAATLFGRILTEEIVKLARASENLGLGEPLPRTVGIVIEVNDVASVLSTAASDLQVAQLTTARLASIAAATLEALIGVDRNRTIESWNRAATLLLGYEAEEVIGQSLSVLVPVEQRAAHGAQIDEVFSGKTIAHFDSEFRHKDGRIVPVSKSIAPIIDANGRVTGLVEAAHDISERREWERRQSLMSRELMHRVKNSLAVAQSIVRSTLRTTPDPAAFAEAFTGRLASMAAAQDIVTVGEWKGADLENLARHQLAAHLNSDNPRIHITGEPVQLQPATAVPLGLALHELGTNAAKYGSLTVPEGTIDISWTVRMNAENRRVLHLEWREMGGPEVAAPSRQGFGGVLIDRGIGDAVVERRFEPSGLVCTIELAIDSIAQPTEHFSLKAGVV